MATKIVTKNSSTASAVPTASDLLQGELAVNVADKRLFTEDNAGAIVELGTNPSTLTVTGEITANGGIALGDSDKATFGASDDLQIYHDGSNSWIQDAGTGILALKTDGVGVSMLTSTSETMFQANKDSDVRLYYDNAAKLATTSTGIDVTGTAKVSTSMMVGSTDAPSRDLEIKTSNPHIRLTDTDGGYTEIFGGSGITTINADKGQAVAGSVLKLSVDATDGLTINSNHNVSIPNGNILIQPTKKLYLDGGLDTYIDEVAANTIAFNGGGAERMRIDSGGSVLIGKSTPTDLHNTWNHLIIGEKGAIISENGAGGIDGITLADNVYIDADTGSYAYQTTAAASQITQSSGAITFSNAAAGSSGAALTPVERIRIDSSGNVLVGKTSASSATVGFQAGQDGFVAATRASAQPLVLNRTTDDGTILDFRREGTTTGTVGSAAGNLYIVSNDVGLNFAGGGDGIYPATADGAQRDAAIDLGHSSHRFKDLYLSGGVRGTSTLDITVPETSGGAIQLEFGNNVNDTRRTVRAYKDNFEPVAADDGVISLGQAANRWKDLYLSGTATHGTTPSSSASGVFTEAAGRTTYSRGSGVGGFGHLSFINGNGPVGSVVTSGSATAYNTSSDYRLKENAVAITGATDRLKQLAPKRFNFIADANTTVDGFLAHEVADVVPEAITGTKDAMMDEEYEVTPAVTDEEGNVTIEAVMGEREVPDYQGIDQSKLVPLLVATIQELEARITQLENN